MTDEVFAYDVISSQAGRVSGPLTVFRNTREVNSAFRGIAGWQERMEERRHTGLDEGCEFYGIEKAFAETTFHTPLSPYNPWRNGGFTFPSEWYWEEGRLTNNLDAGVEFACLHFMRMKYRWRQNGQTPLGRVDPRETSRWLVDVQGFSALSADHAKSQTPIHVTPNDQRLEASRS